LDAGVVIRFNPSIRLQVGTAANKGALVAVGTTSQPIVLTTNSATPAPGQWYGVYFDQQAAASSVLDHVTVEYAGSAYSANVRVDASSPTIRNSTIRNSSVYGLYAASGANPLIQGNTFTGNANFDAYMSGASNVQVTGNTFASAVYFDTAAGTHAVTGNTFNAYNTATRNLRVGAHAAAGLATKIGRASCRERVEDMVGDALADNKNWADWRTCTASTRRRAPPRCRGTPSRGTRASTSMLRA